MFQSVAEWFATQTEAVKLALIALVSAFGAGVFGIVKEWRKPVLTSPSPATSSNAPRSADDPLIMLTNAVEALNFQFADIKVLLDRLDRNDDRIIDEVKELEKLVRDLIVASEIRANGLGM